ncbi:MAG: InlB B-repeat-containing protein [Clostridia bacterium]|nr:InlB B-repeat-containing protein [Clostridia bacterium]
MTRISYSKRFLSLVLALALITACMVVSYAGSFDLFTGDDNTNKCEVKITSNGGKIEYVIGSVSRSTRNQYIGSPDLGADCILTAVDTATRQFMYWQDEYSGRVYSYDRVLSFKASSRMNIRAVFANVDDNQHFVSYVNYGDTVMLDAVMYANGATITPPTDTKLPGFTFNGWSKSSSEIQSDDSDMIVYPQYTVNNESYTVAITNDAYVSGAGTYSNFQTVNVKAEEKDGAGKTFSYWKDADDVIVSYERNYSFRINYNVTLTAVYGEDVTPEPVIRISKIHRDTQDMKITFYAERSVPESYTVLEHGILMATGDAVQDSALVVSSAGDTRNAQVRKVIGKSNEQCGTFSLAKAEISYNTQVIARPFVITADASGAHHISYGDVIRTTNGAA